MADQQPASRFLLIAGGVGLLVAVALLSKKQGNTLQPTVPTQTTTGSMPSSAPVSTNTLAWDMTSLNDPMLQTASPAMSLSGAPAQYVTTPSGSMVPFIPGLDYMLGSIIHFADGTFQQVGGGITPSSGYTMPQGGVVIPH